MSNSEDVLTCILDELDSLKHIVEELHNAQQIASSKIAAVEMFLQVTATISVLYFFFSFI